MTDIACQGLGLIITEGKLIKFGNLQDIKTITQQETNVPMMYTKWNNLNLGLELS